MLVVLGFSGFPKGNLFLFEGSVCMLEGEIVISSSLWALKPAGSRYNSRLGYFLNTPMGWSGAGVGVGMLRLKLLNIIFV